MDARRQPPPSVAAAPGSDPDLVRQLRAEIERDGPITFARFMEVALYDPSHGYYATSEARPTRAGDFLTAPELDPVFGRLIGRQVTECWERLGRPIDFTVREYGAGRGTLAVTLLEGMRADGSELAGRLRYEPIEVDPTRQRAVQERVRRAAFGDTLPGGPAGPEEGESGAGALRPLVGVVIANEFLDALPVHRVEGGVDGIRELYVGWRDGRFVDVPGRPSDPRIAARLEADGIMLSPGQRGEVCLAIEPWVREVAGSLKRGWAFVIDYGHPAEVLYARRRWAGTLLGYLGHRVVDDPYANVGRQDLTAHVDRTALERDAASAGLSVLGTTTQAEALTGLGLGDIVADAASATTDGLEAYLGLRSAAVRLLDPRALGGFAVTVLGRDVPIEPPLRSLAFRLPTRAPVA